jgi:hypothetical protein
LIQPIIANETFSHAVFFGQLRMMLSKSNKHDFGGFVEIKDKIFESKVGSESAITYGLGSTLLSKSQSLQMKPSHMRYFLDN